MKITPSDIDRLAPPKEADDLIRLAADRGCALWGAWQTDRGNHRMFGVRVKGSGWDMVVMWSAPTEGDPVLSSVLLYEDGAWAELASLDDARTRITRMAADKEAPQVPDPGQRIAFTGGGKHWHGTVTRNDVTGPDHTPRLSVDVDPGNDALSSVIYRLGDHFRPTRQGETCPDCGQPDRGPAIYSRI